MNLILIFKIVSVLLFYLVDDLISILLLMTVYAHLIFVNIHYIMFIIII